MKPIKDMKSEEASKVPKDKHVEVLTDHISVVKAKLEKSLKEHRKNDISKCK